MSAEKLRSSRKRGWQEIPSERRRSEYGTKPRALGTGFDVIRRFQFTNGVSYVGKRVKL